jgi:hypothetical protein
MQFISVKGLEFEPMAHIASLWNLSVIQAMPLPFLAGSFCLQVTICVATS